ncbi:MAG: DUF932 domain-containing protein [Deltaproteobacteria bacterium]|nr:DUF932 domain-containing protein [Deltaproteobacteria bacterium]
MLNHPKTAREAIEAAGLDYCVVRERLEANAGLKQESFAALRTDNGYILGVVHDGYESIQNRDAFKFCDYLVGAGEALYEAAGKFGHGEHIWILVKLSGFLEVPGSDRINKYLLLTNSHDGSAHVCAKVTPIRVVCNNTLTSALQGAGDIQISHTHDAVKNLEQAVKLLEWSNSLYKRLNGIFNAMASQKITEAQLQAYVQALVPDNEETETDERTENIRQSVLQLYESGRGANLSGGTLWGAFNSVTEYTDHLMLSGNATARLNSIWFGRGEQLKLKAFRLAMQMM